MSRVGIKICGLTRAEDVAGLEGLEVDFAGFIFAPSSPRFLAPEKAAELLPLLPRGIRRVGVFLDADPETVRVLSRRLHLDFLQFHGAESPAYCRGFGLPFFKAFRVRGPLDLARLEAYRAEAVLLDAYRRGVPGGTGETFDWNLAREAGEAGLRVVLAGGLNPQNVAAAVRTGRPWAVDVSSGVELSPGIKDPAKLREFVRLVRAEEKL